MKLSSPHKSSSVEPSASIIETMYEKTGVCTWERIITGQGHDGYCFTEITEVCFIKICSLLKTDELI